MGSDEFASVEVDGGSLRHGLVLEVDRDLATVQILESTDGMSLGGIRVRFEGRPLHIQVGTQWLGRVCNGRGVSLCFWSSGEGRPLVVEGAVSEHGVDDVAAAPGQVDDGGVVFLPLAAFLLVVGL